MSFDIDMGLLMQYAFNVFGSVTPMLYLFIGASFAIFILAKLLKMARGD